jgi:hypothetical protein
MIHHDNRDYQTAVSEAGVHFQKKIEDMIHTSVPRVKGVIEQVQNDVPSDALVYGKKLKFAAGENGIRLLIPGLDEQSIHEHAFRQVCERTKLKNATSFMRDLRSRAGYGPATVVKVWNDCYEHGNGSRYLTRSVRGELRGFLSDRFKRRDSRPLLDAFLGAILKYNAHPVDGFALQTKMNMRAILPMVFEPFPGEIMAFGAQLSDSDFGDGALSVSGFVLRMYCTNLATTENVLQQIHLSQKLSDSVEFSEHTLKLDTETSASAIDDVVSYVLGPKAVDQYLALVKKANEEKIEPDKIHSWAIKHLTKMESEAAELKFSSPDVELLPPGQTKWRWSNALSWLANQTEDEHRKLELQEFAGGLLK